MATKKKEEPFAGEAEMLAREVKPADPPAEAEVQEDWDFIEYDPGEIEPWLKAHGLTRDPEKAYRWCETDYRIFPRRKAQGWEVVAGGRVKRGTLVLCEMSKARNEAMKRRIQKRTAELSMSGMEEYDRKASNVRGKGISTFDASK
jgi:hypothetical protein